MLAEARDNYLSNSINFDYEDYELVDETYWDFEYDEHSISSEMNKHYTEYGPRIIKWSQENIRKKVDAEVGDDHVQHTDAPLTFLMELYAATKYFSISISEKDTYVSEFHGNYSENFILKPQSWSDVHLEGIHGNDSIIYLDIAKIRTLLPVKNMRQKHSDTLDGKISLLNNQDKYDSVLCKNEVELARTIQYVMLDLNRAEKFPFLPTYLGGYGAKPLFGNSRSLLRSMLTYKNGRYFQFLCSLLNKVKDFESIGLEASFLKEFSKGSSDFDNWISKDIIASNTLSSSLPDSLDKYQLGTLGKDNVWDSSIRRLLTTKLVVTESELLVRQKVNELFLKLTYDLPLNLFLWFVERYREALRPRDVNYGLIDKKYFKNDHDYSISIDAIDTFIRLTKPGEHKLKLSLKTDRIYSYQAMDSIYSSGLMRVYMPVLHNYEILPYKINYGIRPDLYEEYLNLYNHILSKGRPAATPTKLVSDDPVLLLRAREHKPDVNAQFKAIILVTNDQVLATNMNIETSIPVFQIFTDTGDAKVKEVVLDTMKFLNDKGYLYDNLCLLVDKGSLDKNSEVIIKTEIQHYGKQGKRNSIIRKAVSKIIRPDMTKAIRRLKTRTIEMSPKKFLVYDEYQFLFRNSISFRPMQYFNRQDVTSSGWEYNNPTSRLNASSPPE